MKLFSINEENDKNILYSNSEDIINSLIKITIKLITKAEESISHKFLQAFDAIVHFFANFRKIKIDQEIIENITSLGAFGKPSRSRRFSIYFCTSLIRICTNPITELFSRLMILSSDSDSIIKAEFAFHIKFICRDLEESIVRKNVLKIVNLFYLITCINSWKIT